MPFVFEEEIKPQGRYVFEDDAPSPAKENGRFVFEDVSQISQAPEPTVLESVKNKIGDWYYGRKDGQITSAEVARAQIEKEASDAGMSVEKYTGVKPLIKSSDIIPSIVSGAEQSIPGIAIHGKPTNYEPESQLGRQLQMGANLAGDLPVMTAGYLLGGANPITGTAGAFALPAGIRKVYIDKLDKGEVQSVSDFLERFSGALKETAKGYVTGLATGAAGEYVPGAAKIPAEIAAMTATPAALEGRMPEPQEFLDAAIMIGGLKASAHIATKLRQIYADTGKMPNEIVNDIKEGKISREEVMASGQKEEGRQVLTENAPTGETQVSPTGVSTIGEQLKAKQPEIYDQLKKEIEDAKGIRENAGQISEGGIEQQTSGQPGGEGFGQKTEITGRRQDFETRKRVAEMTPDEMQSALLTDELTGLKNKRAYAEAVKKPVQVKSDVDGLKWINDNYGEEAGNALLNAKADALKAEGVEAYRTGGDEYYSQFDSPEQADVVMKSVAKRLEGDIIEYNNSDGTISKYSGGRFSYGIGRDVKSADEALRASKEVRERAGERAGRGVKPVGLVEVAEGQRMGETRGEADRNTPAREVGKPTQQDLINVQPEMPKTAIPTEDVGNPMLAEITAREEAKKQLSIPIEPIKTNNKGLLELNKSQRQTLEAVKAEIEQGEPARRQVARDERTGEVTTAFIEGGTYPDYFKGKGYTKKDALNAINKALNDQPLTENQRIIVEDLNRGFRRQATDALLSEHEKKIAPQKTAWDLKEGDKFKIEGEGFKVTDVNQEGFLPEVTVKDGKTYTIKGDEVIKYDKGSFKSEKTEEVAPAAEKPATESPTGAKQLYAGLPLKEPIENLLKQDIIPNAEKTVMAVIKGRDDIRKIFAPYSRGAEAAKMAGNIRQNLAELAQKTEIVKENLKQFASLFDKASDKSNLDFIDNIETGTLQNGKLNIAAKTMREILAPRWREIQKLKGTDAFIENYFPHFWEQSKEDISGKIFNKKPLQGPASFLKQRTIPTTKEGIALGLKPVTTNPVELTLLKAREMDRFIMGQKIFNEMKETGQAEFIKFGQKPPEGYTKINDKIARVLQYSETEKGMILRGEYYAPEPAARLLNNYLSPGLKGNAIYDAFRGLGNILNQVQLGMSAYHLAFTSIDAITSKFSLGLQEFARGQYPRGLKDISPHNIITAPFTTFMKGSKVLEDYYRTPDGMQMAGVIDALIKGGGRVKMDSFYKNSAVESFWKALKSENALGAIPRSIPAAVEYVAKPIMEIIVPRQKLGVFADMVESQLKYWQQHKIEPTLEQQRAAFGKMWDSVDNRMGQLVYDNLFWNKTLKDVSMVSVRSVGWNLGTFREVGGGVKDIKDIERIPGGFKLSPRTAYIFSLPIVTALVGATLQYLYTGQGPDELKDYFFPKTGRKLPDGRDERVTIPSYMKDIVAYTKHPFQVMGHKVHPAISSMIDMLKNEDFYGTEIKNANDPIVKQAQDVMTFIGKQFIPFSFRNAAQRKEAGGGLEQQAESFFGVTPAPGYMTKSSAENLASELMVRHLPRGPIPQDEYQHEQIKKDILNRIKNNQPIPPELITNITSHEFKLLAKKSYSSMLDTIMPHLSLNESVMVWQESSQEEKEKIRRFILKKVKSQQDVEVIKKEGINGK